MPLQSMYGGQAAGNQFTASPNVGFSAGGNINGNVQVTGVILLLAIIVAALMAKSLGGYIE